MKERLQPKSCPSCQQTYLLRDTRQVYCSQACAHAATKHVTIPCAGCGKPFHPKRSTSTCCSKVCASKVGTARLAAMRAAGCDPAHGGPAREARQASLARRRAAGERLGRHVQRARKQGIVLPPREKNQPQDEPAAAVPFTLSPVQIASAPQDGAARLQHVQAAGEAYRAAGERYEQRAARALKREQGQIVILAGHGAALRVERDALVVSEGHTHFPQTPVTHTFFRGMHQVERIICFAASGAVSFPALAWCSEQGISLTLLERDGSLLQSLTPEPAADAALRRRQYEARNTGQSTAIARAIVEKKIRGQLHTLQSHQELPRYQQAATILHDALSWFDMERPMSWLERMDILRSYEGRAAKAYFAAWQGLPVQWEKPALKNVPPHWLFIRERNSPLSSNGRHAVDPCNALLNYAYACLEGQCQQALSTRGFDLTCGFLHADQQGRDSLIYDLMELYRARVDSLVLSLLKETTFHAGDITPVSDGSCRLHPQLARYVVARCRVAQEEIDSGAIWLKNAVLAA